MKKQFFSFAGTTLFSSIVGAAPFCAVTSAGTNCWYFDAQSCRQAAGPSGACVVNQNEIRSDDAPKPKQSPQFIQNNRAVDSFNRGMQDRARERAQDQEWELRQIEIDQRRQALVRQNTDPRLLPLSPEYGISPETHSAIMSTLFAALDMNSSGVSSEWKNPKTGTAGNVIPKELVRNIFGEPCREFTISLRMQGRERFINGTACRKNSQWVWQGS